MREAGQILFALSGGRLPRVHAKRLASVQWAVTAAVAGGRVGLTAIGRSARGRCGAKHSIKRADRLVGNEKLFADHDRFFRWLIDVLIDGFARPVVLVDWTGAGDQRHTLVAALAHEGRALPILFEVHDNEQFGKTHIEGAFLERLRRLLPDGCRPVLVTDAGFRSDWIRAAEANDMDFVTRVPGYTKLGLAGWPTAETVAAAAGDQATDFGLVSMTKGQRVPVRLVRAPRYRPPAHPRKRPKRPGPRRTRAVRRAATQAWVLATSLDHGSAEDILGFYALRMQIEEQFRDNKSHRFGLALRYARGSTRTRYANLTLIACLAAVALTLTGRIVERVGLQRRYQANTERKRRVLSFGYLARLVLAGPDARRIHRRELRRELGRLKGALRGLAPT